MKTLLLGMILTMSAWANVGQKEVTKDSTKIPEDEETINYDYQTEADEIRGTERQKHQKMEEEMQKDLNEPDDDLRMQKDY